MDRLNIGIQPWNFGDVESCVDEFLEIYDKRPVAYLGGGMNSAHLFWTWYALRKLNPKNIIESGIFKGNGTWFIEKACPAAKVFSIDINLSQRVYVSEKVTYFSKDFDLIDWSCIEPEDTVCFFDDHQNAYMRMQQMKWMGFKKAMFEDNYPISQGDCYSCKKILSECGLIVDGELKIEPNSSHAKYFCNNIKTYTTFPPLFKSETTRWGDKWDDEHYPTPTPIFDEKNADNKYKILKDEANGYTWLCYVELN